MQGPTLLDQAVNNSCVHSMKPSAAAAGLSLSGCKQSVVTMQVSTDMAMKYCPAVSVEICTKHAAWR